MRRHVQKSHDVKFTNCVAEDYTRIGFVTDLGVHNVSYSQYFASNGHHASVMFGGAESNAGFWSEQSENVTFSQCLAENNTHIGFVAVPGGGGEPLALFMLTHPSIVTAACRSFQLRSRDEAYFGSGRRTGLKYKISPVRKARRIFNLRAEKSPISELPYSRSERVVG